MRSVTLVMLALGLLHPVYADEAADRAALDAAAEAWVQAFNARDAAAMASLATEDVVLLSPDSAPVVGRASAAKAWQQALPKGAAKAAAANKETVVIGDHAWRIDALSLKERDGRTIHQVTSLAIWKRIDGEWRLHRGTSGALTGAVIKPQPLPSEPVLDEPVN